MHLERGLRGARGSERIPVFVCHPLDPLESRDSFGAGALGVLYPTRVLPDTRCGQLAFRAGPGTPRGDLLEEWRLPSLWVRVRYVFLVTGGGVEEQLGAIAAALRTLHDTPFLRLDAPLQLEGEETTGEAPPGEEASGGGPDDPPEESSHHGPGGRGREEPDESLPDVDLPVRLVEDGEGWREIGLAEHHLTISFEVTVPIASSRTEAASRILERELQSEEDRP